ncbi:hypothetical protein ACUNFJ_27820, partial [Serratia sp. IR-2025]
QKHHKKVTYFYFLCLKLNTYNKSYRLAEKRIASMMPHGEYIAGDVVARISEKKRRLLLSG